MPPPNYRGMGQFGRLAENLDNSTQGLSSPQYRMESTWEDLDPRNFDLLDREIARARTPAQRAILLEERRRLEELHRSTMEQSPAAATAPPSWPGLAPAEGGQAQGQNFMDALMQMVQRRHGRMPGGLY